MSECGQPTLDGGRCPETNHCGEMVFPHHPEWGPILCTRSRGHDGPHMRGHFSRWDGNGAGRGFLPRPSAERLAEIEAAPRNCIPRITVPVDEPVLGEDAFYQCPVCQRVARWTDGRSIRAGDDVDEYWCQTCGTESPLSACALDGAS